jgi:hypothetical protein
VPLTTHGRNVIAGLLFGNTGMNYFRLMVGDGTAADVVTQSVLSGTNTLIKSLDAGYPTWTTTPAATFTFQATFGPTEANFHWTEWGCGHTNNSFVTVRKLEDQGTKQAGQTWLLRTTVTITSP